MDHLVRLVSSSPVLYSPSPPSTPSHITQCTPAIPEQIEFGLPFAATNIAVVAIVADRHTGFKHSAPSHPQ